MSKAMVGDLIRIVDSEDAPKGRDYDVIYTDVAWTYVGDTDNNGEPLYFCDKEYEVIRKQAHAAQVGDLIRITKARDEITAYKLGGIYEVISLEASNYDQIVISGIGGNGYVLSDEYEIHRKMGEEDSPLEIVKQAVDLANETPKRLVDGIYVRDDAELTRVPPIREAVIHVGERVIHPNKCRTGREFLAEIRAEKAEQFACAYAVDYDTKYDATDEQIRAIIQGGESDVVNSPNHYGQGRVETIEVIEDITSGYSDGYVAYCVGNTIKYLARAPHKHDTPTEDLRKAAKYLEFAIGKLTQ